MPQRPYDKPVSREQKIRTSSGLISLLWMFVGALIAVMIGFFLYLSPLFDGFKTDVEVNAPVEVEPLPQTNTPDDFEFYEVLPTREFQTGKSMTDIESAKQSDEPITKPDAAPDAVVVFEQSDATKPKQENVSVGQTDAVLITEEELIMWETVFISQHPITATTSCRFAVMTALMKLTACVLRS